MAMSLAALAAAFTLLNAYAANAGISAGSPGSPASASVLAFDSDNGNGNNGHGNQGNANSGSTYNENQNEDESTYRGRHSAIVGCIASSNPSHVFTLQTSAGLITVQPTGNALHRINSSLTLGRIVTAQGHFAGNGVYIAQQLSLDGFASNGACAYAAQPFPTPGNQQTGNVVVTGTIQSISGNSLRLSTNYGVQTVVYDANTLVDYGNTPVGSGALRAGESVTVVGLRQNNGSSIYARTIQIQSGVVGGGQNAVLTGVVINANIGARQFTVFSGTQAVTVNLTSQTVVQRGGTRVDPSTIRPTSLVTVYGNRSGNVVTATLVQL
jgi:hypothetical protein